MDANDPAATLEARLADVDLLRRRVLNVIPHALRTPITTFRGLANALERATDDEIRTQIAPALQRLAAQAEHLLDDMLIAAGVSTALPTASPVTTPVETTALDVWSTFEPSHDLEVTGDTGASVRTPPGILFKVFVHILDNARRYGAPPVRVTIERGSGSVVVAVSDAGTISEGDAAAAFEAFYRGEAAVMAGPGLGVGLTVARALVEQAGGSMRMERHEGGARVVVELPEG